MATRKTAKRKFDPVDIRMALEVLKAVGQEDGYAWELVEELLPESERPPVTSPGSVYIEITEPPNEIVYTTADHKKLEKAIKDAWIPLEVNLGKKGTIKITVKDQYGSTMDWL